MKFIQILQGFLAPVIAVLTLYIASQQWKGNKLKLRMEQYDRRYAVYLEVWKLISQVLSEADISTQELLRFSTATSQADFLFGPEMSSYVKEIFKHGNNLSMLNKQIRYYQETQIVPDGYDHVKSIRESTEELEWFSNQLPPALNNKFRKYLDLNK